MLPYVYLLAFVTVLGFFMCELKKSKLRDGIFLAVVSIVLLGMSIARAQSVGTDYPIYLQYFQDVGSHGFEYLFSPENTYRYEPGYGLLNFIISRFSMDQIVFATVVAVIMIGLTVVLIYRYSSSVWLSMFVFVSFGFFGYTLVTIRQQMAVCIFLFAIPQLQKRKLLPYILITILAAMFHKSLWIALPVYFIAWLPLNKKTLSLYGAGTALMLLFTNPILNFITQFVFKHYTEDNYYRAVGRNFQTAFIPVLLFIAVLLMQKRLLERDPKNLPLINFTAYACFLFILTLNTFIYQRVALIFLPAAILLIPELLGSRAVDSARLEELSILREAQRQQKKQNREKYVQLKAQVQDERLMYYTALGYILFGGITYYLFLLVANRLGLVPYLTIFAA